MKRLDLKIQTAAKSAKIFDWDLPSGKVPGKWDIRYLSEKILRYASEKYYRIHTCKAKTSTIKYTVCWKNNKQAYKILSRNTENISSLQKYFTVINSKLLNWKYVEKYIERSELGGWVQESEIKYETNFLDGP